MVQLVEWLLPSPVDLSSNPAKGIFYGTSVACNTLEKTKIKKKRLVKGHHKNLLSPGLEHRLPVVR